MAFVDTRNQAELLLAPRKPLDRSTNGLSSIKLKLGGDAIPGVVTSPSQLTGPLRNTLSRSLANKTAAQGLSASVSAVLAGFDAQKQKLLNGSFIPLDPLLTNTSTGIPGVQDFFQFSALKPGQPIPNSFLAIIEARKKQLQSLAHSFSKIFTSPSPAGVQVTENVNPTTYPLQEDVDRPDVSPLAQGGSAAQNDPILKDKTKFAAQGVQIAQGKPSFWSRITGAVGSVIPNHNATVNQQFKDRHKAGTWSEPPSPYAAQFPYNHVQQTESGHVIELDDTPGAERVHIFHRAGSFIEFHPDGSVVYKTMKHNYRVTLADEYVKVSGNCHVSVDGNSTLYCKGDVNIQGEKDVNVNTRGDFNVFAKNINLRAKKTSKVDGTEIDLRYITLPTSIMPVSYGMAYVGFAPRVNLSAVSNDTGFVPNAPAPSMRDNPTAPAQHFPDAVDNTPPANPLSNWSAYTTTTPASVAYRAKMFDSPQEVQDVELYTAHVGLQQTLGDTTDTSRQLGGNLVNHDSGLTAPDTKPSINYLNFDDFKGTFNYANNYSLGGTSFTLADVSDLNLHPDIVSDITPQGDDNYEGSPSDSSVPGAPNSTVGVTGSPNENIGTGSLAPDDPQFPDPQLP